MVLDPVVTDAVQLPRRRLSRAEQNDAKRRLLLASALEVLTEQGYQAMTLEEVAERAGFTRRPIYTLFGSKEQLALALFQTQTDRFTQDMLQVQPGRTLKSTLKRLAEMHSELAASDAFRPMFELQTALNGVALRDEAIHRAFTEFLGSQHERFVAWLAHVCEVTGQRFRAPLDRVASLMEAGIAGLTTMGFLDPSYQRAELRYHLLLAFVD
ncbi:TetR/AcrR family transcriptional regulator [Jatrophihabitans cynanchi]|uniref:TetR/AcrR family transcriptional regulator n=1 Tax=Jatrophihabitans cynanchi TaxID=2944128 RepID=A0ABY7K5A3_9ACTN|nr:TetR/AcrR family transcriptional regulator [Jatrophihabitans sp. SB3-54]WAX58456.1 TetR/AcrR family transcriptional regulator [Jatrophihabitans sp. SB3-54]